MSNRAKIILYSLLAIGVFAIVVVVFTRNSRILEGERNNLEQKIRQLSSELDALRKSERRFVFKSDSLGRVLDPMMQYEALIKANQHRDEAYLAMPWRYGDQVMVLPDSISGIVSEVVLGGNPWNYYVRYKVLLKGGKSLEVYPNQLSAPK
jgi:hypothetical protein